MKNFLRQNLLAIITCLAFMAAFASAAPLVRPYGSSDYAGGQKAVGSKINSEFDTIVNWLNAQNIASGNIANLGVATDNLAAGAVTKAKLASANLIVSSNSSLFTNTGDLAAVTNLSAAITTTGRPVRLSLISAADSYLVGGSSVSYGAIHASNSAGEGSFVNFIRSASTLSKQRISYAGASSQYAHPCSAFSHVETPAAGSHTYSVAVASDAGITATVSGCRLVVEEL